MNSIKFGTSGFRGIIGDNWTKDVIYRLGHAFTKVAKQGKVIIGFDNRFMGRESAEWFCEALGDKFELTMFDIPVPTPIIPFLTVKDFDFGVMITASHNPYKYNGIKVFLKGGTEAGDEFFSEVTKHLDEEVITSDKKIKHIKDVSSYINKILSLVQVSNIKVLFDAMNGSSADIVIKLFKELGVRYTAINTESDPYFKNKVPAPYQHNLVELSKKVVKGGFDVGFALDGDGDRVAFIDRDGSFWDCNYLLSALWSGGEVAKNHFSSNLIKKISKQVHETPVGFKYLGKVLGETKAVIAGESTGIAFKEVSLSKDGIVTAFLLLDKLSKEKKTITEIVERIKKDVNFPSFYLEQAYNGTVTIGDELPDIGVTEVIRFPEGLKFCLSKDYWVGVRKSGTEPVTRLYVEMPTQKEAERVLKTLENFYGLKERQK